MNYILLHSEHELKLMSSSSKFYDTRVVLKGKYVYNYDKTGSLGGMTMLLGGAGLGIENFHGKELMAVGGT